MASKGMDFEANHLFAYRSELNRMRNGEPGCLALEDNLGLFIERRAFSLI